MVIDGIIQCQQFMYNYSSLLWNKYTYKDCHNLILGLLKFFMFLFLKLKKKIKNIKNSEVRKIKYIYIYIY
jgi:hypothetical protein